MTTLITRSPATLPVAGGALDSHRLRELALLHEDRGTGLTEGDRNEISEPVRYDQTDVGALAEYGSGIAGWSSAPAAMDRVYQNFRQFTRSRDLDETSWRHVFIPLPPIQTSCSITPTALHYPNTFENLPSLTKHGKLAGGGCRLEITPKRPAGPGGLREKDFDDPARKNWDGIGWSLELDATPEQDTIVITSSHAPEETSLQGDFINRETLKTDWTTAGPTGGLRCSAARPPAKSNEQSINDRKDYIYNISARANYAFRRWFPIPTSATVMTTRTRTRTISATSRTSLCSGGFKPVSS